MAIALYAFMRYYPLPPLEIFYAHRHRLESCTFIFVSSLAIGWISGKLLRGRRVGALAVDFQPYFYTLLSVLGMVWDGRTSHDIARVGYRRTALRQERFKAHNVLDQEIE